jgi:hypothetical protein
VTQARDRFLGYTFHKFSLYLVCYSCSRGAHKLLITREWTGTLLAVLVTFLLTQETMRSHGVEGKNVCDVLNPH